MCPSYSPWVDHLCRDLGWPWTPWHPNYRAWPPSSIRNMRGARPDVMIYKSISYPYIPDPLVVRVAVLSPIRFCPILIKAQSILHIGNGIACGRKCVSQEAAYTTPRWCRPDARNCSTQTFLVSHWSSTSLFLKYFRFSEGHMTRGSGCCSIVRVELEKKRQTIHHSSQEKRAPRYGRIRSGVFEYDLDIRARLVHICPPLTPWPALFESNAT